MYRVNLFEILNEKENKKMLKIRFKQNLCYLLKNLSNIWTKKMILLDTLRDFFLVKIGPKLMIS